MRRETMPFSAKITCAVIKNGSTVTSGFAPCPPRPMTFPNQESTPPEHGSRFDGDAAGRRVGVHVLCDDKVHAFHGAVIDHARCAADALLIADLLGWLEQETHRSGKFFLHQQRGRAERHGRVAVMSAGVHHAGVLGNVGYFVRLQNGQRIHVRADGDDRFPIAKVGNHAGSPNSTPDPVTQRFADFSHFGGRASFW